MLALGAAASPGRLELRSNWQLYVEEFGLAMHLAGCPGYITRVTAEPALSLFERKYRDSGHALWAFSGRVRGGSPGRGGARDGTGFMG